MPAKDDLDSLIDAFEKIPGQVNKHSKEAFEEVFGSAKASSASNIIYFFLSSKPIPRLNGESNILYIGQTKNSFKSRYFYHVDLLIKSQANELKYNTIINKYGPIEIAFCDYSKFGKTLLQAEGKFLWSYFQRHCEYPPLNYTKTSIREGAI